MFERRCFPLCEMTLDELQLIQERQRSVVWPIVNIVPSNLAYLQCNCEVLLSTKGKDESRTSIFLRQAREMMLGVLVVCMGRRVFGYMLYFLDGM